MGDNPIVARIPVLILYCGATVLEFISVYTIFGLTDSICIEANEISSAVAVYLMFTACPIIPNICYMLSIFLLPLVCKHPMSVIYNLAMGTMCIVGSLILTISLTMCGNEAQVTISLNATLGLIAGICHILNAAYSHCTLPWDESYLKRNDE